MELAPFSISVGTSPTAKMKKLSSLANYCFLFEIIPVLCYIAHWKINKLQLVIYIPS